VSWDYAPNWIQGGSALCLSATDAPGLLARSLPVIFYVYDRRANGPREIAIK
jgi:hypothetical protein